MLLLSGIKIGLKIGLICKPRISLAFEYYCGMDAKKTIAKLRGESDRIRTSLYLSQSILADFKDVCGDVSPSKVMEELMKQFVESSKNSKKKSRKR